MAYDGPARHDPRSSSPASRGVFARFADVVLDDLFGEMTWMIALAIGVAAVVGLIWVAAQLFA